MAACLTVLNTGPNYTVPSIARHRYAVSWTNNPAEVVIPGNVNCDAYSDLTVGVFWGGITGIAVGAVIAYFICNKYPSLCGIATMLTTTGGIISENHDDLLQQHSAQPSGAIELA